MTQLDIFSVHKSELTDRKAHAIFDLYNVISKRKAELRNRIRDQYRMNTPCYRIIDKYCNELINLNYPNI